MDDRIIERCIKLGNYMVATKCTVRQLGEHFEMSKTVAHKDVAERLREIDDELAEKVSDILKQNKAEFATRGGRAHKKKKLNARE